MRADIGKLRRGLGSPKPPKEITQEPYDITPDHLPRLASGDWRENLPKRGDLFDYVEDINYCDVVQPDLFRYMLPVLLEMWRQDLMGDNQDNDVAIEWLYPALARRRLVKDLLGDRAEEAAGAFMRDAILDRIDNEKQLECPVLAILPQDWIGALAGLGAIFPAVDSLWREWWRLETPGQARALLQYVSALIYDEDDNPVFTAATRETDGGPPRLWEPAGNIFEQSWLPENIGFLRNILTADYVEDGVRRAAKILRGSESDVLLDRLVVDLPGQNSILERRVAALPEIFSGPPDLYFDWDDAGL